MTSGRPLAYDPDTALEAAMQVFWLHGYEATSLQDLLRAMGLSKSSFYQAFGSKKELFLRCVNRYCDKLAELLRGQLAAAAGGLDFIEQRLLDAAAEAQCRKLRRGCMLMSTANELAQKDLSIAGRVDSGFAGLREIFAEAVRRGQTEGTITTEQTTDSLADFLICNIGGIKTLVKGGADEARVREIVAVILRGLL